MKTTLMKNRLISITSLGRRVRVLIRRPAMMPVTRLFPTIDQAFKFAVEQGNRRAELFMNGYACVPHSWTE